MPSPPPPPSTISTYGCGLRELFKLDPTVTFLNHGSFGLTPRSVLATQQALRDEMEAQPVQFLSRATLQPRLRAAAASLATFLGADGGDLALTDNATTGANAVLRSLHLKAGDEVLITDHTYGAVRNTVRYVCGRSGARIVDAALPFPGAGRDDIIAAVTAALTDRTRLAVLDFVTSGSAMVMPAAELVRACRAAGARVLIDAAHAPGMVDLDLRKLDADWVTGNAHKWLFAPKGCAFLWARAEAQDGLHPTVISHGYEQGFTNEFDWTGTRDPTAWLSITAALEFYAAMGGSRLRAHNHALAAEAADMLARHWRTEVGAPTDLLGSMAAVRLPGQWPATTEAAADLHDRLWHTRRIEVPVHPLAGRLWVRISAQIYNEIADFQRLATTIADW